MGIRVLLLASLFLGLACTPREQLKPTLVEDTLYFGLNTMRGPVTPSQWNDFLRKEVTPRFPDGLTVWDAKGQWKDAQGVVSKEPTKVLMLIHPDTVAEDQTIQAVIDIYKKQFHQESVLKVRSRPEVSF